MLDQFSRTELLLGEEGLAILHRARLPVFGIGGVGGHLLEALVRSGVGELDIFDNDTVALTNLNRQIVATHKTLGMYKVDAAVRRMLEINPDVKIHPHRLFYSPDTSPETDLSVFDYVADAIDFVPGKLELAVRAQECSVPIISSMGAGNKLHPEMLEVADIYSTSVCPLARAMRSRLRKLGVRSLKTVYSKEEPIVPRASEEQITKKPRPGSTAFVPSAAGLIMAGEIIKDLCGV